MHLRILYLLVFAFTVYYNSAQPGYQCHIQIDTMTILLTGNLQQGAYVELRLEKKGRLRVFKAADQKCYLMCYTVENFYFGRVDVLNLFSGSKQYTEEGVKQFKISKTEALYVIPVQRNYLNQLQFEGLSGYSFAGAETRFSRRDIKNSLLFFNCVFNSLKP
ncbi:MAG: hypothetical protein ACO27N_09565 [Bacteroidia bacterium]